jgi:hypothetical protein
MSSKESRREEFEKFKDEAVIFREREAAVASLNFSTFVAAVGPLGIGLLKLTGSLPVGTLMIWFLMASSPAGLVLLAINWFRTPSDYRGSKPVLKAVVISIAAAVSTWILAEMFPLRAPPPPPAPGSVVQ